MRDVNLPHAALTESVIGAFYETHNTLGFGPHENVCLAALERELRARGHDVAREVAVRMMYKGEQIAFQRLDMLVDRTLVIEAKAGYELHKAARRQLYNYLRSTSLELGLLLYFGPQPKVFRVQCENARMSE